MAKTVGDFFSGIFGKKMDDLVDKPDTTLFDGKPGPRVFGESASEQVVPVSVLDSIKKRLADAEANPAQNLTITRFESRLLRAAPDSLSTQRAFERLARFAEAAGTSVENLARAASRMPGAGGSGGAGNTGAGGNGGAGGPARVGEGIVTVSYTGSGGGGVALPNPVQPAVAVPPPVQEPAHSIRNPRKIIVKP